MMRPKQNPTAVDIDETKHPRTRVRSDAHYRKVHHLFFWCSSFEELHTTSKSPEN